MTWITMNHRFFVSFILYFYDICATDFKQWSPLNLLDRKILIKGSELIRVFINMKYKVISQILRRFWNFPFTKSSKFVSKQTTSQNDSTSWTVIVFRMTGILSPMYSMLSKISIHTIKLAISFSNGKTNKQIQTNRFG